MQGLGELIGESPAIEAVRATVRLLVRRPPMGRRVPAVLIEGETGTGKGLLARVIHRVGPRAQGPFVDVNCAAIPDTLLEAELFGFERGAFTDARHAKPGLFQAAHRGTIFLDEVGLLPEGLQAKLLKVIEEGSVRRLGSTRSEPVDAWVLSATNSDLTAAVSDRHFREDLYHRLAVIRLRLPALRERHEDILVLAEHFLGRACEDYGLPPRQLSREAQAALLAYPWPGNVRELGNLMERVALLTESDHVTVAALDLPSASPPGPLVSAAGAPSLLPGSSLDAAMGAHLLAVLEETAWNISRSAALLGISRNTLRVRIERLGLRKGQPPMPSRPPRPATPTPPARAAVPPSPAPAAHAAPPAPRAPAAVRWERRRITFLRASVSSAGASGTPMDASRPLETMLDKIRTFDGRVLELAASWIGAAFGLDAVEDAPRRAMHAAMAIQKAAERSGRDAGEPFAVRIGIHVGEVLVGQTGGQHDVDAEAKRREWAVLETLLAVAEPGSVLVSAVAAPFLDRRFELARRGASGADGFQLAGRERTGFAAGRRMARFVGRQQELNLIESRLASARSGHGQIIGIAGEAGIGKSRLLWEFRQTLRPDRATYLEGRCLPYGTTIPYLPVLEILRHACRITDPDTPETIALRVRATLKSLDMDGDREAPHLLRLMGVKDALDAPAGSSPEAVQGRAIEALRQMLVRASRARPLVLAVEDAHWLDHASEGLASLVESLAGIPVLVILTYRPGWAPPWMQRSHVTQLALPPLSAEDSLSVVRSVLRTEHAPEGLAEMILGKAEGNPFFLEELVRVVGEQDTLPSTLAVPASVEEVLRARINGLDDAAKRLLQLAAVIGREVPVSLLGAVWDEPAGSAEPLRELTRLEFLRDRPGEVERVCVFSHALTQEVAYRTVLEGRLRGLHAAVGHALERSHAGRENEAAELLAYHFGRSAEHEPAVDYALLAAEKAQRRWANNEALALFSAAVARLDAMPDTLPNRLRRIDAVLKQAEVKFALGQHAEHVQALEGIRHLVEGDEALDPRRRAAWHYWTGFLHSLTGGRPEVPIAHCREASRIAEARGFDDLAAFAECCLAQSYAVAGDLRAAVAAGERALGRFEAQGNVWWACRTLWVLNTAAVYLGEWERSLDYCRRGLAHGEAVNDTRLKVVGFSRVASTHIQRGDPVEGLRWCAKALALSPLPYDTAFIKSVEGYGLLKTGQAAAGVAMLVEAVEWLEASHLRYGRVLSALRLTEGYLRLDDRTRARALLDEVLATSREFGYRHVEAVAERLLGACRLADEPDAAAAHLDTAERLLAEVGARNELAKALVTRAELLRAGDPIQARRRLEEALEIFESLGTLDEPVGVRAAIAALGATARGT